MNNLRRIELHPSAQSRSRLSAPQKGRKIVISLLAGLIALVMIAWFGFLVWGLVAIFQWLLDSAKIFLTTYI